VSTEITNVTIKMDTVGLSPSYSSIIGLKDGRLMWVWGEGAKDDRPIKVNYSSDMGKMWTAPVSMKLAGGGALTGSFETQLVRLTSGAIGLSVTRYRPADGSSVNTFHRSTDEGATWSDGVDVSPPGTDIHTNHDNLIVLRTGRVVMPSFATLRTKYLGGDPKKLRRFGEDFAGGAGGVLAFGFAYYSDDEGRTWQRSKNESWVILGNGVGGSFSIEEPAVVEMKDGRVMMVGRTQLGQYFKAYSDDGCETWSEAVPTGLASGAAPCNIKRIPRPHLSAEPDVLSRGAGRGEHGRDHADTDLLVIWNQTSPWELMQGYYRHRLTCAISKDDGETWQHHRNLESLDDVAYIETPPIERLLIGKFRQPTDRKRYHRAPGPLRQNEPALTFVDGKAVITYGICVFGDKAAIREQFGIEYTALMEKLGLAPHDRGNRVRVLDPRWFYGE